MEDYASAQAAKDKKKQIAAPIEADKLKSAGERLSRNLNNPGQQMDIYGDSNNLENINSNLSQVGAMTGQNIWQTGQQQQDYLQSLQSRRNGDDSVAANMMAGRNRNLANVGRQFAGRGVAGGVAAAGMNTATNTADSGINAQKQTNSKQNDAELWNYVKRNQKVEGEALAGGEDKALAQGMDISQTQGAFGTIICTEMFEQGIMDQATYDQDVAFGMRLEQADPFVLIGYRKLGRPVVKLMRKSKVFSKFVAFFGMSWANHMAGRENKLGCIIMQIGVPLCRFVGKTLYKVETVNA